MKVSTKLTLIVGALLLVFSAGISGVLLYQTAWNVLYHTRDAGYTVSERVRQTTSESSIIQAIADETVFFDEAFRSSGLDLPSAGSDYTCCTALVAFPEQDNEPGTLIYRDHMLLELRKDEKSFGLVLDEYSVEDWRRIDNIAETVNHAAADNPQQLQITAAGRREGRYFYPSRFTLNGEALACTQYEGDEELSLTLTGVQCDSVRLNRRESPAGRRFEDWKALFSQVDDAYLCENFDYNVKSFDYTANYNENPELTECFQKIETYITEGDSTVFMLILLRATPLHTAWTAQRKNIALLFVSALLLLLAFHKAAETLLSRESGPKQCK